MGAGDFTLLSRPPGPWAKLHPVVFLKEFILHTFISPFMSSLFMAKAMPKYPCMVWVTHLVQSERERERESVYVRELTAGF